MTYESIVSLIVRLYVVIRSILSSTKCPSHAYIFGAFEHQHHLYIDLVAVMRNAASDQPQSQFQGELTLFM